MIRGALRHLPGIGAETMKYLDGIGIREWQHVLDQPDRIPVGARKRERIVEEIFRAEQALADNDVAYFIEHLAPTDQWRTLGHFFDRASYFDIEISGLTLPVVTATACYHRGTLHSFLRGENLDDFLVLLEDVDMLVSFNGASFDVPMILSAFRIPSLPCPHLDLRWVCYHGQLRGGLKSIERHLGIARPPDLQGVDGEEAIWLWQNWRSTGDQKARLKLQRYCGADAISLQLVAARVLEERGVRVNDLPQDPWMALDVASPVPRRNESAAGSGPHSTEERRLQQRWQKMKTLRTQPLRSSTTS